MRFLQFPGLGEMLVILQFHKKIILRRQGLSGQLPPQPQSSHLHPFVTKVGKRKSRLALIRSDQE
ncbi:MAG TPA: hypothetical protein DCR87_00115 [Acidobacteria bacterium]|nr:hypothetical protein [Acidobacteriota bacterium]